jgi:hypothetical protein
MSDKAVKDQPKASKPKKRLQLPPPDRSAMTTIWKGL